MVLLELPLFALVSSLHLDISQTGLIKTVVEIKLVDVPDMGYVSSSNPPRGEVWISGGNITLGYFKNPEKTY